jgi:hypothetical protein
MGHSGLQKEVVKEIEKKVMIMLVQTSDAAVFTSHAFDTDQIARSNS